MPRYRIEVLREIPCAPFLLPVSPEERSWLRLDTASIQEFTTATEEEAEAHLIRLTERIPDGRTLDRTRLGARNLATRELLPVWMDLSEED